MKNNVNKQIIKALSVGLAASMALQPVAVYAEEGTGEVKEVKDPVDVAFENATRETQEASDALVTTDENKNLETKVVDGNETQVHVPSATVATENEKEVVSGVAETINPKLAADKQVGTDGYDTAATKLGDDKNKEGENLGADGDVQDALTAIDEAKTANGQIKDSLNASQDVLDSLEDGTTATPEKNGVKEAHQVNVDQYGVKANEEKGTEATGSIKDSNNAEAGFVSAGEKAGEAAGQFNGVADAASKYAANGADSDVTGTVLAGIKIDAENANKTLAEANELLAQAESDLAAAQDKKDDADIAYADAEKELDEATKALKAALGLDADAEITAEDLKTTDAEGNDELGASAKKIQLAKEKLAAASAKLAAAKSDRDTAKLAVEKAVNGLNNAKYAELVALQDEITKAENSEELTGDAKDNAVKAANENFKKALIKYYYFQELKEGETVEFASEVGFDISELNVEVRTKTENNVTYYFAGYDADNDYAEVWRPVSELGSTLVAQKKNAAGEVVEQKRYSVTEENGVYTIVDITEAATAVAESTGYTKAKYVIKDQDGKVIDSETKEASVIDNDNNLIKKSETDEEGNTVMHVADKVRHEYETEEFAGKVVTADALATTKGTQVGDKVYVKTNENPIVDVDYKTDTIATGKNVILENQDQATNLCYDLWTANQWCGYVKENVVDDKYKDSVKVQYRQKVWWFGEYVYTRWFDDDKDLGDYLGITFGAIFGTTQYQIAYKADVDTGVAETEDITGLLVETKDQYDVYEWGVKEQGQEAKVLDTNKHWEGGPGAPEHMPIKSDEQARTNHIKKIKEKVAKDYAEIYKCDASDLIVTVTEKTTGRKNNKKYEYTYTVTKKAVDPTYEWVKQDDSVTNTTSKIMYNSKDYDYVAPEKKTLSAYYNLGYNNGTSEALNNGKDQSSYDKQRVYNSAKATWDAAKATFDAADEAYAKAEKELQEAQAALESFGQLELAGRTKKEYVDKYNDAKDAFDVAAANKKDAEDALQAAKDAKTAAELEFTKANTAKTAADKALGLADAAKKAADDARNATPDDTDDDADDDTTTGGDDTTTASVFVAGPATTVVTPVVANDNGAVLGEVRKTSTKSSKKAAATSEAVSTDNGNSNNSEVAGAKKEETKTPEAPKTETKIEDTETALAATPELEEKGFAWWWLLILAAIAGVSVEEYARRKSNKAKAEAKDSTKVNK